MNQSCIAIDQATWTVIFTAVLAFATIVLAWGTLKLSWYTKTLATLTKELVGIEKQREDRIAIEKESVSRCLLDELDSNLSLIDQKKDILQKMLNVLNNSDTAILPGTSAHAETIVYDTLISIIYTSLKPIQRDNLHVIYQHLKQHDSFMDSFEENYKNDLTLIIFKDSAECRTSYKSKIGDVIKDYNTQQSLIRDYREGTPRDVFPHHT
jgi:hypothetical protein